MTTKIVGSFKWGPSSMDDEGHREYKVCCEIQGGVGDGPANVRATTGLPVAGSQWNFGSDVDIWASRKLADNIKPLGGRGKALNWEIEFIFSTKPQYKLC